MIRSAISNATLGACLLMVPALFGACSGDPAGARAPAQSGTFSMPLTAATAGHTYRLRNAAVNIYGPTYTSLYGSDDPNEAVLATTLQTGSYTANLYAWTLERADDGGIFAPVSATLVSSPSVGFSVFNGTTTTV